MRKLLSPILFILISLLALPLAYSVNPIGLPQFSYDGSKGTASVTQIFESTKLKETGLVELQMYSGYAQAIIGNPTTCDPSKAYQKAVPYAFDQIGERLTITIRNENIPDGSYTPLLVHVDKCCSTGSCAAQQPFGWGYPLTSGKITFKRDAAAGTLCIQDVLQCPDGSSVGRDAGNNCNFRACPNDVDFQLSNLKIITSTDIFANTGIPLGVRFLKATKGSLGDVYALSIKNTGTANSGAQLEAYYVSKTNPFYSSISSFFSPVKLQSFAGQEGITQNPQTCKNEVGASYTLDSLAVQESKTLYIFVPYPAKDDKLAGNANYNPVGEYLLAVDAYDNCQSANIHDITGGTLNFEIDSGGNIKKDGSETSSLQQTHTYQKTIKREDVQKTTATDLLKSACSSSDVCEPASTCESMQSLIDNQYITETKAKSDISVQQRIIADTTGVTIGAVGAALIGTKAGLGLCTAFGAGTAGLGLPICLGVLASGGAILGGTIGDSFFKIFKNIDEAKLNAAGYCMPEDDGAAISLRGITTSIGKAVNDFFGTRKKVGDFVLGAIVIGFVIFLFLSRK